MSHTQFMALSEAAAASDVRMHSPLPWLYPIDWRELSASIRFRRARAGARGAVGRMGAWCCPVLNRFRNRRLIGGATV